MYFVNFLLKFTLTPGDNLTENFTLYLQGPNSNALVTRCKNQQHCGDSMLYYTVRARISTKAVIVALKNWPQCICIRHNVQQMVTEVVCRTESAEARTAI